MTDIRMNRNWLIIGLVILLAVATLIFSVIRLLSRRVDRPRLGQRSPVAELAYCGTDLNTLCIVSFSQVSDGGMLVNFQIPDASFPDFILTINNSDQESTYKCQRSENSSTSVVCIGTPQLPGQMLDFKVISQDTEILLAEGKFSIIGIALVTPEATGTATIEATTSTLETPLGTATATPTLSPFQTRTQTPTPSTSYPNPSYP